jgi:hypothetical protein
MFPVTGFGMTQVQLFQSTFRHAEHDLRLRIRILVGESGIGFQSVIRLEDSQAGSPSHGNET